MMRSISLMLGGLVFAALIVAASGPNDEEEIIAAIVQDVQTLSITGHVKARKGVDEALLDRLLSVDIQNQGEWQDFADSEDQGIARLINRGIIGETSKVRGGGAYFSFATRSHSYDESPQIELQQFAFSSGFYGGSAGVVVPLSVNTVRAVTLSTCPAELQETYNDPAASLRSYERQIPHGRRNTPADVGRVYAVRWASSGEFDTLAAIEVVARDEWTATIAWRVLKQFPTPKR